MIIKNKQGAGQVVQKLAAAKILSVSKSTDDAGNPTGEITARVSAFGNKDLHGDIVDAEAFKKTLAEWVLKERPIPMVWSHDMRNLDSILGKWQGWEENADGLDLKGTLDLTHAPAARVYELMDAKVITEFSWSGEVRAYEWLEDDDEDAWWPGMKILEVDLWEAGPCFKGANPETELLSLKADGRVTGLVTSKAGRVLSKANLERLKSAHATLGEILAEAETTDEDDDAEKTAPAPQISESTVTADPIVLAALEQFNTTTT